MSHATADVPAPFEYLNDLSFVVAEGVLRMRATEERIGWVIDVPGRGEQPVSYETARASMVNAGHDDLHQFDNLAEYAMDDAARVGRDGEVDEMRLAHAAALGETALTASEFRTMYRVFAERLAAWHAVYEAHGARELHRAVEAHVDTIERDLGVAADSGAVRRLRQMAKYGAPEHRP